MARLRYHSRERVLVPVVGAPPRRGVIIGRKPFKRLYLVRFPSGHTAWLIEAELRKAT